MTASLDQNTPKECMDMSRNLLPIGFMMIAAGLCYGVVLTSETFCIAGSSACAVSKDLSAFEYLQDIYALGE